MSAEPLRKAAALMRERAEAARAGRWVAEAEHVLAQWTDVRHVAECSGSIPEGNDANARHIASWHPHIAPLVAAAMDQHADLHETYDCVHQPCAHEAWAAAYLGETSC